ncbi:MAG TPA: hydrogenase 3 maturation endopeptidase HyCI [Aggregatilineales bacterium]|nr:hydrogenase 3 maturation endopeptidase HyCI [Aggregatilineales bacterium]
MTSQRRWQQKLTEKLARPDREPPLRVAVVGVGQVLNGDDAAGVAVAQALQPLADEHERLLVIDAGPAPENVTGALRRFSPDFILFVDAAQMEEPPGTVRWLEWEEISGVSASTHTLPLHMVAAYLQTELGAEVALLGIQPGSMVPGTDISPVVQQAVDEVAAAIAAVYGGLNTG